MPDTVRRIRRFDFFGFAMLSLAIGALQLMLDRGEQIDWFSSTEILIELGLAIAAAGSSSSTRSPPRSRSSRRASSGTAISSTALVFIFIIGIILLATMALLPPMLQNLFGYPVVTVGMVMAPRGIGTMVSMLVVGRLVRRVDARVLVALRPHPDRLLALADDRFLVRDGPPGRSSSPA